MKRVLSLFLVTALLIGTFAACKQAEPEPEIPPEPEPVFTYQNGKYSVEYEVPALDRTLDFLTISITDDKISVVEVGCKEGAPVSESASESSASEGASAEPVVPSSPASASSDAAALPDESEHRDKAVAAMKEMVKEFEAVDYNVDKLEAIDGMEEHSYRFMRMMREALDAAKSGNTEKLILGRYADGNYESVMPSYNAKGWKEYVRLTVKDGEISDITFDASKEEDSSLHITEDPDLNKEGATNKPSEYYPAIAKSFIESGSLDTLEIPDGGSAAAKSFHKLMRPLLNVMTSASNKKIVAPMYVDGVYKAQMKDFDANGWKDYLVLRIRSDEITVKEFDAISKADEQKLKSQDSEMAAKMKEKTGTDPSVYNKELAEHLDNAKGDPIEMDGIAGATVSSNNFRLLAGQILATSALAGDTEAIEVAPLPADMGTVIK